MNTVEIILRSQENLTRSYERESTTLGVLRSSADGMICSLLVFEDENLYGIMPESNYFRKMILI